MQLYSILQDMIIESRFFEVFIPIVPVPKQSVKIGKGHGYVPTRVTEYIEKIKTVVKGKYTGKPVKGLIGIELCFCFPFRTCDKQFASKFPYCISAIQKDLDNLKKPVFDAISGILIDNDRQICYDPACKIRTHKPGIGLVTYKIRQRF